jgi:hypothetical protein
MSLLRSVKVPCHDAGGLLPAVLEGMESVVGLNGRFGMAIDPEDAAIASRLTLGVGEFSHVVKLRNNGRPDKTARSHLLTPPTAETPGAVQPSVERPL